jgi:hypothetical protein
VLIVEANHEKRPESTTPLDYQAPPKQHAPHPVVILLICFILACVFFFGYLVFLIRGADS